MSIKIKTDREIGLIRDSCRLTAEILTRAGERVKPGITTEEITAEEAEAYQAWLATLPEV